MTTHVICLRELCLGPHDKTVVFFEIRKYISKSFSNKHKYQSTLVLSSDAVPVPWLNCIKQLKSVELHVLCVAVVGG